MACIATKSVASCPSWVKPGPPAMSAQCPDDLPKAAVGRLSQKCSPGDVAIRGTEDMECPAGLRARSVRLDVGRPNHPPHFSVSSVISLPKSAGEPPRIEPPRSASFAFTLESMSAALISRLSLSTISAGACEARRRRTRSWPRSPAETRSSQEARAGRPSASC